MTCDCQTSSDVTATLKVLKPCLLHLLWAREYAVTVFAARVTATDATAGAKR